MECYRLHHPTTFIQPTSQEEDVRWGEWSIVQAELNCLRDLLKSGRNWTYALDLAGSEVMLATNKELVSRLDRKGEKLYTASYKLPEKNRVRIRYKYKTGEGNR